MTVFTEMTGGGQATTTETKADILRDIEDAVDRVDEFIDELNCAIDSLTDEGISDEVDDAASDLGLVAEGAMHDIRRGFNALYTALADNDGDDEDDD